MLTNEQLEEIRERLNKAQNPLFFFDNDCDGLISFILLRRYIGRGKGVAIKSFPGLDESYAHRIDELGADYIFILDKPIVSDKFFEQVKERNLPIVWIDHHEIEVNPQVKNNDFVSYYNPMFSNKKSSEPVSCIAYSVSKNKEDVWLAVAGCIADNFLPDFYSDFSNKYSELSRKNVSSAFEVLYETEFGNTLITKFDEAIYVEAYLAIYDKVYLELINAVGISAYSESGWRRNINIGIREGTSRTVMDTIAPIYRDALDIYLGN